MGDRRGVALVVGVGVGVGGGVAERFAREGFRVAVVARNATYKKPEHREKIVPVVARCDAAWGQTGGSAAAATREFEFLHEPEEVAAGGKPMKKLLRCVVGERTVGGRPVSLGIQADATEPSDVAAAMAAVRATLGEPVSVLVYNVGARRFAGEGVCELDLREFEQFWRANCFGALLWLRAVVPAMLQEEQRDGGNTSAGTVIFTGATGSLRAAAGLASFSVGKFGLRALAQSAARELGPKGVHVAHVILDGPVNIPVVRRFFPDRKDTDLLQPDAVADAYVFLHRQKISAWTHELDLRPSVEPVFSKL
jgi:NAD(P)-dependent dehydrogenase (short-subunit alcohol dehydrogenase family)